MAISVGMTARRTSRRSWSGKYRPKRPGVVIVVDLTVGAVVAAATALVAGRGERRQRAAAAHGPTGRSPARGQLSPLVAPSSTPPEVKCELGRMRAGTGAFPAPCSDRDFPGRKAMW